MTVQVETSKAVKELRDLQRILYPGWLGSSD